MNDAAPLAPVLGVRRDGSTSASSASDLLITVFGELMLPNGDSAWTQTLVRTLGLFDVEAKAARQAISRLSNKGWVTSERVGRRSRWSLTPWATSLLQRGAARIYAHGEVDRDWDGQWLVLLASVPEQRRTLRPKLNVSLGWAGFGSLGQGVWICPWTNREREATAILRDLDIGDATLFRSTMTDVGDPRALAERAWELDALAVGYRVFLEAFDEPSATCRPDAQSASRLIDLVDAWRRFPLQDPSLPAALHSSEWPGDAAADRFRVLRAHWGPAAARWWAAENESYGEPTSTTLRPPC
ncbi:PaaX family transcriptional regulator C-terminal domain-containing protein [uncultured Ilumatobacter sp.]|jgi:phenylacetic acid degradation operon negative regulatory protein|uniref:PaaX family transcriptional regulator n=1 Tax=uncultured Ilumatobacter sp. TaxID=879968 RepID=UPI00374F6338